jgi:hypothetical protein
MKSTNVISVSKNKIDIKIIKNNRMKKKLNKIIRNKKK